MAKINLDKYYTPKELAKHCIDVVNGLGLEITETIEPSAGNGSFSLQIPNCIAFDLEPEHESIIRQDFLKLDLPYKKGRLFIGNPPFGERNILVKQFYNKCVEMGDGIAFILPITQLNNSQSLYKFNLIHSEDLGVVKYSDRDVHCCFNIYIRNRDGSLNTKQDYTLKDIDIIEYKRSKEVDFDKFDFAVCTWGNGCCGKIPTHKGQFAQEHYLIIKNDELRYKILDICNNTDWKNDVAPKNTSSKKIQTWRIYKYLKEQIPELN